MLTDLFVIRYEDVPIFRSLARREQRVLHQAFTILEDLHPFWREESHELKRSEGFWDEVHRRTANELGVRWLSQPHFSTDEALEVFGQIKTGTRATIEICRNWFQKTPNSNENVDEFIKERLSLIEVGLRCAHEECEEHKKLLALGGKMNIETLSNMYGGRIELYGKVAEEINARLSTAQFPLHYHNGFFQLLRDDQISSQIEQPFWSAVSEPIWENVDLDMKEALDQRDTNGKDPALYAGKALESTIKIISNGLGVTHGREKGAHSYIDNVSKKGVEFLCVWERDLLKDFFTKVRNPLGHGPGNEPMPTLTYEQSSWAIETAMSWVKLLVDRYSQQQAKASTP